MQALIEGLPLKVDMIYSEEMPNSPHLGLNLGPLDNGIDWRVECPKLQTLLLEEAERTSRTCYQNNAFRLSVAADYIEDYPESVSLYKKWGKKPTLPPTTEFLALVLRSVVE